MAEPYIRKVSKLTRNSYHVILPKEIVKELDLAGKHVAITVEGDKIILTKVDLSKLV